jgi:hypothetical protein
VAPDAEHNRDMPRLEHVDIGRAKLCQQFDRLVNMLAAPARGVSLHLER